MIQEITKEKYTNKSFIFVPFKTEDSFADIRDKLNAEGSPWTIERGKPYNYFLKFIADKSNPDDHDNCLSLNYNYNLDSLDFLPTTKGTFGHKRHELPSDKFDLSSIKLFLFSSGVGILCFGLTFDLSKPKDFSNALFYCKKPMCEYDFDGTKKKLSDISEILIGSFATNFKQNFFVNEDSIAAYNVLSLVYVDESDFNDENMYFLRHCYDDTFNYVDLPEERYLSTTAEIRWGVTTEACVACVCPQYRDDGFLYNQFAKNFSGKYLAMYVYLLHQKYALYSFLSRLDVKFSYEADNNQLEKYSNDLDDFKKNFDYKIVTEVPQYQMLYSRIYQTFGFESLYRDVEQPLAVLNRKRQEQDQNAERESERRTNTKLFILSLLGIFSALVDAFDFSGEAFPLFRGWTLAQYIFIAIAIIIISSIAFVPPIRALYRSFRTWLRNKKNNKNKKKNGK